MRRRTSNFRSNWNNRKWKMRSWSRTLLMRSRRSLSLSNCTRRSRNESMRSSSRHTMGKRKLISVFWKGSKSSRTSLEMSAKRLVWPRTHYWSMRLLHLLVSRWPKHHPYFSATCNLSGKIRYVIGLILVSTSCLILMSSSHRNHKERSVQSLKRMSKGFSSRSITRTSQSQRSINHKKWPLLIHLQPSHLLGQLRVILATKRWKMAMVTSLNWATLRARSALLNCLR